MTLICLPDAVHRDEDYSLDPEVVESLWHMEERHFWHRARNGWILDALAEFGAPPPCPVLEVGCGSGAVATALQGAGYQVTGVDTAEHLARKADERCPRATFIVGDVALLPEQHRGPFQVIGFFDVLEHLSAPEQLLRAAIKFAAPGALLVATVPALRSLYSVVDELSGHKLRYEQGELAKLFESVGASDVVEHGIFSATLPFQRLARARKEADTTNPATRRSIMCQALRVPPQPVNAALGLVARVERWTGLRSARG
ncbi:MAG TPA: class I SAM-dependent methyltransferase, partial [Polyangiaceae bacterium]|nr:class I SAM-dependent methyltransferase [Polyangiaceae bacterium]